MQTIQFEKVAVRAAVKAGSYIKSHVGKVKRVHYKGEINVVTDVDKKAEEIVVSTIRKTFPRHSFLAEEKTYAKESPDFRWIIDPLDGTTNFLHSFPFFSVSIALEYKEKILIGVVYDPMRGELFSARRKKGAFLNHKRIHVSRTKKLKKALLSTGFAYDVKSVGNDNIDNFIKFLKSAQAVRRPGSAALDLCYVASGRFDGFWELGLNPWDTAAAHLIVEEAGGKITTLEGEKFSIYGKEILAANQKIHPAMLKILSSH